MPEYIRGDRIKHLGNPEWGLGQVLDDSCEGKVRVFFVWAGEKSDVETTDLIKTQGEGGGNSILDTLQSVNLIHAYHNVYVIKLGRDGINRDAMADSLFRTANPNYVPPRPCVYVGHTGRTVEERFERHLNGIQAGRGYVRRYGNGARLMYELFNHLNPRPYYMAKATEVNLAIKLRNEGYGVWQN